MVRRRVLNNISGVRLMDDVLQLKSVKHCQCSAFAVMLYEIELDNVLVVLE